MLTAYLITLTVQRDDGLYKQLLDYIRDPFVRIADQLTLTNIDMLGEKTLILVVCFYLEEICE